MQVSIKTTGQFFPILSVLIEIRHITTTFEHGFKSTFKLVQTRPVVIEILSYMSVIYFQISSSTHGECFTHRA